MSLQGFRTLLAFLVYMYHSRRKSMTDNISNKLGLGIDKRIEVRISIDKENHREFDIQVINQANRTLPMIIQ